jgi:hypothetical protein
MYLDFLVPIAGMVAGMILLLPVVRATVRIVEKKATGRVESDELLTLRDEIRIVQDRLDRVEDGDHRIAELEERLDFAERLLAQQRDAPRVEGGR